MRHRDTTTHDEERLGGELVRTAAATVGAPLALRTRVRELEQPNARAGWRASFAGRRALLPGGAALAGGFAAVAVAIVLATGGDGSALGVEDAQAAAADARLTAQVQGATDANGVTLPARLEGWRATRSGSTSAAGREIDVVSYVTDGGAELRYAVVDGEPLARPEPTGGAVVATHVDGQPGVTWRHGGRTCILTVVSGRVPAAKLLDAARSQTA